MTGLPDGWTVVPLMEIVDLHDSRRIPLNQSQRSTRKGPYPYFGANGQVDSIDEYIFDGEFILLAEDGGYFDDPGRPVAYEVSGKFWVNNHAHILSPKNGVPRRLLTYALNQLDWMPYVGGSTRLKLTQEGMKRVRIALPPECDRERLAAKLDNLFARTKKAREELSRIPALVHRYKLAVLASAFKGELTAEFRNEPSDTVTEDVADETKRCADAVVDPKWAHLPLGWKALPVEAVGHVILGRQRSPQNHSGPHMRPYVRAANITWRGWDLSDVKHMNFDESDFKKFALQVGDVLVNEGSGSADEVGKPAVWTGQIDRCCFQNTLIAVRPHAVTSEYLYYLLYNAARSKAFVDETRGVNIHHIGRAGLARFIVPIAPWHEQKEIVRRIRGAFARVEFTEAEAKRASELLYRLEQAALAKAFRGELGSSERLSNSNPLDLVQRDLVIPAIV